MAQYTLRRHLPLRPNPAERSSTRTDIFAARSIERPCLTTSTSPPYVDRRPAPPRPEKLDEIAPEQVRRSNGPPSHRSQGCQPRFSPAPPGSLPTATLLGVYDPAQAKIEALSCPETPSSTPTPTTSTSGGVDNVKAQTEAVVAKHRLMVLWADFFAPAHFEEFAAAARAVLEGASTRTTGDGSLSSRAGRRAAAFYLQYKTRSRPSSGRPTRTCRWASCPPS